MLWERFVGETLRPRGLGTAVSRDAGRTFKAMQVPDSAGSGWNGSLQGLLARKLAVSSQGAVAVVNSTIDEGAGSRVWLMCGR